ncbi:MAG: SurA N-terminal domain-containing protein, partial [Candidatus Saccharibacteria bacterium]|nr:SurA N-terminal domain-containing protein [Candidatus Saccharibacteria bacterium]
KAEPRKTEQERVEERREEVLATGRKFKYPLQWTRYRIVGNTILIAFVVIAILITSGWLALYEFGMTNEMLFRVTKIFPVPVAVIDAENVRFSDYLMFYRSSITSIERQSGQIDNESSFETLEVQYKKAALSESEEYTYALKLARELNIDVTDEEVEAEFKRHLSLGGVERSEESFMKIVSENFGLNRSEYDRMLYLSLIKAKVEMAIDEVANATAIKVEQLLSSNGGNYKAVAEVLGPAVEYEETDGMVSSQNIDGGRAAKAAELEPGGQSGRFVSANGDGYYFVKLIAKNDTEVNFVSIKVPFTEFSSRIATLREDGGISEFISFPEPFQES